MHHNAMPGMETVNLGGGSFMIWDRIFGTFVKPPKEIPTVGLTNSPEIHMNPMRITYSGIAQIWYELKMNKGLKTKFFILLGGIYYKPPITKEYLIKGYPNRK